jgi:hypothetical protein
MQLCCYGEKVPNLKVENSAQPTFRFPPIRYCDPMQKHFLVTLSEWQLKEKRVTPTDIYSNNEI